MASRSKTAESSNGRAKAPAGSTDELARAIAEGTAPAGSGSTGKARPTVAGSVRRDLRSLTLTALLGVFILAVFLAVARHFLPKRVSTLLGGEDAPEE